MVENITQTKRSVYNDGYLFVKGAITVDANKIDNYLTFKNNNPFTL